MLKLKLSTYSNTIISSRKEMLWIPSCWEKMLVIRLYWKIWYEGIQLQNIDWKDFINSCHWAKYFVSFLGPLYLFLISLKWLPQFLASHSPCSPISFWQGPSAWSWHPCTPGSHLPWGSCQWNIMLYLHQQLLSPQTQLCKHYLEQLLS